VPSLLKVSALTSIAGLPLAVVVAETVGRVIVPWMVPAVDRS